MKYTENYNLPLYEPNDLANLMDGYNESMNTLDDVMKTNIDIVDDYTGTVAQHTKDIAYNKAEITAINKFLQHKMLVIGDSYSETLYSGDLKNNSSLWWYKLANHLNLNPIQYTKSGAGFVRASGGITLTSLLNDAISDIADKDDYRYVFVMGGLNDISQSDGPTLDTFNKAFVSFVLKVKNNFPKSTLVVCGPNTFIYNEQNSTTGLNQYNVSVKMKTACFATPAVYIDISKTLLAHSSQFNSYNHPNADGEDRLAGEVLNGLLGRQTSNNVWLTENSGILEFTPNTENQVTKVDLSQEEWYFTSKGIHAHVSLTVTIANPSEFDINKKMATGKLKLGIKGRNFQTFILCSGRRFMHQNTAATNYAIVNSGTDTQISLVDNGSDFTSATEQTMSLWYDFDFNVLA